MKHRYPESSRDHHDGEDDTVLDVSKVFLIHSGISGSADVL